MTNPYEPSEVDDRKPPVWSAERLHMLAGAWLTAAGVLHLIAINLLAAGSARWAFDWKPLLLTGLGVMIIFRFRVAIVLARLIGSFTIVALCVVTTLLILAGFDAGGELTYGNVTVTDPKPWQFPLMLFVIGVTVIPPWWALQRALAGNHRAIRTTRLLDLTNEMDC